MKRLLLRVIICKKLRKGNAKRSKYTRLGAFVVQENAEGPVEGKDLLAELPAVSSTEKAKELVRQLLEGEVEKVEFIE